MTVSEVFKDAPTSSAEEAEITDAMVNGRKGEMFYLCGRYGLSITQTEKLWGYAVE